MNINSIQLLSMLKNGNPQQIATQLIQQKFPNDPMMQSLLQMAINGDEKSIEQFATQFFNSQGRNVNTELNNLQSTLKNFVG